MSLLSGNIPTRLRPFLQTRNLTVGADPEMFVFAGEKLIPAFAFLPAKGGRTAIYWDGFQAEWKYYGGFSCLDEFCCQTYMSMRKLLKSAREFSKDAKLSLVNTVHITEDYFKKAKPEHIALGCLPSYNANDIRGNPVFEPTDLTYRFAGGHIHFGGFPKPPNHEKIVLVLDAILGVWSVGAAEGIDTPHRRMYYGLAGEYRKPQYSEKKVYKSAFTGIENISEADFGVEYRTLSNFWLCSPQIANVVLELGRTVAKIGKHDAEFKLWAAQQEETVEAIQTCNVKLARTILKRNENLFKSIWKGSRFSGSTRLHGSRLNRSADMVFNIGMQGVASVTKDPMDIENNWFLKGSNYKYEHGRFCGVVDPGIIKRYEREEAKYMRSISR